jgi:hypothetical protein
MVVVAASGDKCDLIADALRDLKAQHADIEGQRAVEIRYLQVNMPDPGTGGNRLSHG